MDDFILGKYAVKQKEHDLCPSIWNVLNSDVTSMIEYNRLADITSYLNEFKKRENVQGFQSTRWNQGEYYIKVVSKHPCTMEFILPINKILRITNYKLSVLIRIVL